MADLEPVVHQVAPLDVVARERVQLVEAGGVLDVRRPVRRVVRTQDDGVDIRTRERPGGGIVGRRPAADARRRRQQRQADQRDGPACDDRAPRSHAPDATIGRCEI